MLVSDYGCMSDSQPQHNQLDDESASQLAQRLITADEAAQRELAGKFKELTDLDVARLLMQLAVHGSALLANLADAHGTTTEELTKRFGWN